jgi:DNA-binding protein YbaB
VESARQPPEGLGVGVSVGVISGVLERLADENMTEDKEDTMEEELWIGSSELEGLRVDDVVIESTADADTLEDWLTDALDGSKED